MLTNQMEAVVKFIIGIAMVVVGVAVGIWAGVWWAFIGGIVDVVQAVRAVEVVPMDIAIGVAKILFCGAIGWLSAIALVLPGVLLIQAS